MSDAETADSEPVDVEGTGSDEDAYMGRREKRREDAALLTGRAEYTDDHEPPGTVHLAFVRSEHGHADLEGIDASAAEAMDGVLGVYTWADVDASPSPGRLPLSGLDPDVPAHPILATDRVRYHGQPIAAVVAEDRYRARDAVDAVEIEYEPREAVVDPRAATDPDAPQLFEAASDNVATAAEMGDADTTDEAFSAADRTVEIDLENNRLIPSALEPRAAVAEFDADDGFTVTMTSQSPHGHRRKLAHTLGVREGEIRVVSPRVGGGFGHKGHHHPGEAMAAWCARELERPVKWTATRSGNYLEGAHGRDHRTTAELAVDDDGSIRGVRAETVANVGGYGLGGGARMPVRYGRLLSSQYAIDAIHCETRAVFTNTAPIHSYRGAGRPEAIYVTERLIDIAADELGMDPVELRRRNLLEPDEFPYETPVGATYDSGDYEPAMEKALEAIGYDEYRDRPEFRPGETNAPDDDGLVRGVGVANYVESTAGGFESGLVRALPDGDVEVYAGTHSHGQGHETTYAQLVADALEVPLERIHVSEGDTAAIPTGTGTFGSRSTLVGGNAVVESAEKVLAKARQIAAAELGVDPERVEYEDGTFTVLEGDETVSFAEVADVAYGWNTPDGLEPGLEATTFYESEGAAYTFGTHACIVAVDPDTGDVEIERYVAVDDCGERVNPLIVDGQVHGGVAQGIGQALYEAVAYDEDGTLLTDSMDDYGVPRAADVPPIETDATVTPSPLNDLGVKGIGEAGTIAAPPAAVNAVCDAIGVDHVDMPLTGERVWRAIASEQKE